MYYTLFQTSLCEIILVGDEQGISYLHLNTHEGKRQVLNCLNQNLLNFRIF